MFVSLELHISDQVFDLKAPNQISIIRFKELLVETFTLLSVELLSDFELVVLNKPIHIEEDHLLSDYSLGDGDQVLIKEITNKESDPVWLN